MSCGRTTPTRSFTEASDEAGFTSLRVSWPLPTVPRLPEGLRPSAHFVRQFGYLRRLAFWDEPRDWDLESDHAAVFLLQAFEVVSEEFQNRFRSSIGQVLLCKHRHLGVVFCLAVRVHVKVTAKPPDVTIKLRTDVIQLVEDRGELFLVAQVEEPRQVEREDVQHLSTVHDELLNGPFFTVPHSRRGPLLKTHGSQFGLETMADVAPGLSKRDRHISHADMAKLRVALSDVDAQVTHRC